MGFYSGRFPILVLALLLVCVGVAACCPPKDGASSAQEDYVELKVPVSDPTAAVRRLAVYGIPSFHNLEKAAVLVPAHLEERAAMILTFTGMLPDGRKAYGFLSEDNLAMTDQRSRIQYISRLQDVFSETIAASPDISQAEVTLTEHGKAPLEFRLPSSDLARKAMVRVELKNGGRLNEEQQMWIESLVAGAFEHLKESDVRLSDFGLNYYPTIDANWRMNYTIRAFQLEVQAAAAKKIEQALNKYDAHSSVTIQMLSSEQTDSTPTIDLAKSSAAVRVTTDAALTPEQLTELRRIASDASGIPQDNIELLQVVRDPNPAKKRGEAAD